MTEKQKKFIKAIKMGMNQTQAAIYAGYSEKSAPQAGSRLMKDAEVIKYLGNVKSDVKPNVNLQDAESVIDEVVDFETTPMTEDVKKVVRMYTDPRERLIDLMNSDDDKLALDAAKTLMPYEHSRMGEIGKKEAKTENAKVASKQSGLSARLSSLKKVK